VKTQLELSLEIEAPHGGASQVFESVTTAEMYKEIHNRERATKTARRIRFPADTMAFLRPWANKKQEHFLVILLDGAHEVIERPKVVSVGLVNRALVHPREIFAPAIEKRAAAIIIAHNHPSGNTDPSPEDRDVARRIKSAAETLGIPMLDAMVFTTTGYYSMLERGEL